MIPNALASKGPYAGYWGHLRSIDYTLERTLKQPANPLNCLDRERLQALINLLEGMLSTGERIEDFSANLFASIEEEQPNYATALDLRKKLHSITAFDTYSRPNRKGFEHNLNRLITALRNYLRATEEHFIAKEPPTAEFETLHAILQNLMLDAEVVLSNTY